MRHFCVSILLLISAAVARAANVSPADLAALDRLECFQENPLIAKADDMVVLAILPTDAPILRAHGPRLTYRAGRMVGELVESDLIPLDEEVMRGPSPTPPVLRLRLRRATRDRAARKQIFAEALDELRALVPGVHLRCVYDLGRWAEARACIEAITG